MLTAAEVHTVAHVVQVTSAIVDALGSRRFVTGHDKNE